jgi:hypothetical protein
MARPWSARPTSSNARDWASAPTSDPVASSVRLTSSMRRLPYMSPSRPTTGLATAPASRVTVATHEVALAEEPSRSGSTGSRGSTSVWVSDTAKPPSANTAMATPGR